jgi:Type II secretion system protein B
MRYVNDFGHMDTALTIAVVPTLCVFTGGFRIAKEYVPELVDVIFIFSGQQRKIRSELKEEEVQRRADDLIQKEDTKQSGTDWQINLQDIWESYAAYIIVILIVIVVAGILLIISQTPNFNKREEPVSIEAPKVDALAPSLRPNVSATPHTNFTYSGYSYDERYNIRLAIINGNIYHKGDLLPDNYVLKSINPTYIIIRNKADKSELVVPLY